MKNVKLFSFALAALMLGACSSDEVAVNDGQQGPDWNTSGKGYINLAIQLPTQPNTRAWEDGSNFDDGTPAEYEVKDATLLLFTQIGDADFVFNSAYNMDLNFSPEGESDQITTSAKISQEINAVSADAVAALVVLNNNGLFSVGAGNTLMIGQTTFSGDVDDLNTALQSVSTDYNWHKNGWLMSNAVMANVAGGTTQPANAKVVGPLVGIDKTKIKKTKSEADANPAATIYVERAEAKVTLTAAAGKTTESGLAYTIEGWDIDNYSKKNLLVRNVANFATWSGYTSSKLAAVDYRMIGGSAIATGLYRLYWAEDANYSGSLTPANEYVTVGGEHAAITGTMNAADGEAADYCFENTTNLANMTEENLTRVIVKAKFNNGTSFYTVDNNTEEIWTEANAKAEVAARVLVNPTVYAWAKANVAAGNTLESTDFDVTLSTDEVGTRTVTAITLTEAGQGKLIKEAAALPADIVTIANGLIDLNYYKNGEAYYPVYIAHFGETQTPWTDQDVAGSVIYGSDPTASVNYLGRWAAVRNNWYDIKVTSIKALGAPNVEEVTNEPVDKKESFISVNINVLSWAKRTQSVDL